MAGLGIIAAVVSWNLVRANGVKGAEASVDLSLQHAQAGRYQQCVDEGRLALRRNPEMATAYNNVGWCYAKLGKWDDALQNVREAQRLDPNLQIAKNNLAWILEQRPKNAPTAADAELNVSNQHAAAGRYPECIDAARKALSLHSNEAIAYNNIGWCSAKLGKWSDAYDNLREALKINPGLQIAENNRRWVVEEMAKQGRAAARQ